MLPNPQRGDASWPPLATSEQATPDCPVIPDNDGPDSFKVWAQINLFPLMLLQSNFVITRREVTKVQSNHSFDFRDLKVSKIIFVRKFFLNKQYP